MPGTSSKTTSTRASDGLVNLIRANAPYWTGEAEIFRRYWTWTGRTRETDRLWLARQSYKEYWDGFATPFEQLKAAIDRIDRGIGRHEVLDFAKTLHEEFAHYVAFADAFEVLCDPGDPPLDPGKLRIEGNWPENDVLCRVRAEHKASHGELGQRAHFFTEGGYCTLYAEGMKLVGGDRGDQSIAAACIRVYDDEFGHMLKGIAGLDDQTLSDQEWDLMRTLTVEQMQLRIHMRNAQFSYPVSAAALEPLLAGECEPTPFDWERANLRAPSD